VERLHSFWRHLLRGHHDGPARMLVPHHYFWKTAAALDVSLVARA
jgi:hypothetical protein